MINVTFDSREEFELFRLIFEVGRLNCRRELEVLQTHMTLPDTLDVTYKKSENFKESNNDANDKSADYRKD